MTINLSLLWAITTDHTLADGMNPVLIKIGTNEVFFPKDIINEYPSKGKMTAAEMILHLAKTARLDKNGADLIKLFCEDL